MRPTLLAVLLFAVGRLVSGEATDFSLSPAAVAEEISRRIELPPITMVMDAEFIIQKIRIVSDSRQEETRTEEIRQTLRRLVAAATEAGIIVRYGDSVVTAGNLEEVPIRPEGERPDVGDASLQLKQNLATATGDGLVDAIDRLLRDLKPEGRAEIVKEAFGIGIDTPEKWRYALLEKVVADGKRVQEMLGADYRLQITGLDQRIRWARYNLKQLELYYPYGFIVLPPDPK
jgi:hypothetical protein